MWLYIYTQTLGLHKILSEKKNPICVYLILPFMQLLSGHAAYTDQMT